MAYINWLEQPFYFDLATGNAGGPYSPGESTHIPVPTYGNYGGANYSEGTFGGDLDIKNNKHDPYLKYKQLVQKGDEHNDPKDQLDYAFYRHDVATDLARTSMQEDAADLALLHDIFRLDQENQLNDPEASFYAGLTTVAIGVLLLKDNPGLAPIVFSYLSNAIENIVTGFAGLDPGEPGQPGEQDIALAWLTGPFGTNVPGVVDILDDQIFGEPIDRFVDLADDYLDALNGELTTVALGSYDIV